MKNYRNFLSYLRLNCVVIIVESIPYFSHIFRTTFEILQYTYLSKSEHISSKKSIWPNKICSTFFFCQALVYWWVHLLCFPLKKIVQPFWIEFVRTTLPNNELKKFQKQLSKSVENHFFRHVERYETECFWAFFFKDSFVLKRSEGFFEWIHNWS